MGYIKGIDISNNNVAIDFCVARADDVEYVYLKATEGKTFQDSKMDGFYNGSKNYGLKTGAYHFLIGTSSPEEQAENFYKKIKDFDWKLIPMLDIETEFEGLCDYVVRFIKAFKELCPMELGIYTYTGFISNLEPIADVIKGHLMNAKPLYKINVKSEYNYSWFIVSKFNLEDLPIVNKQVFFGMKNRDIFILIGVSILIFIIISIIYYSRKDKEELDVLQKMAENVNDAVVITDNKTNITYVNQSFEKITGYSKEEVLGLKTNYFKTGKHSYEFYKEMWNSINTKGYWSGELWDKKKDGVLYSKKLSIYSLKDKSNNNITKYIGIFSDLTDNLEKENYIEKLKNYNLKTNLPNENLTDLLINNIIKNQNMNFSIIYFTIENYNSLLFKFNEDDALFINPLIKNIKKLLKEDDFIAQIAKNNFILGLSSFSKAEDVRIFVNKLFNESSKLFRSKEEIIFLDMKAGISSYPEDGKIANELVSNAYIALNKALNNNETKYLYYTPELKVSMENEIKMEMLLRRAVENNELSIYYQPQVEINKGIIVGAEALIRWNNKEIGNVSPVIFIPLAKKQVLL